LWGLIRRAVVCRPDVGVCVHLSIYLSLSLSLLHPPLSAPDTPPLGHQALCTARARRGSSCPCLSHVMRRAIVCTHATCLSRRRAGAGSHRSCVCLCSSRKRRPRTPSPSRRRHRGTHARPRAATPCPARPRAVIAACSRGSPVVPRYYTVRTAHPRLVRYPVRTVRGASGQAALVRRRLVRVARTYCTGSPGRRTCQLRGSPGLRSRRRR